MDRCFQDMIAHGRVDRVPRPLVRTTRKQREALRDVYRRSPLPVSYRQFRRTVQPTFGCDGAVTVPWCGMWLCVERDGYVHS